MLEFIDHELIEDFTHQLRDRGVALRFGSKVERIDLENGWPVTILEGGRRVRSEMVLYTAGRVGATDSLNLQACELVPDDRGRLKVDPVTFQTTVPHICAPQRSTRMFASPCSVSQVPTNSSALAGPAKPNISNSALPARKADWPSAARGSTLPCPKRCSRSAGTAACHTAKTLSSDAATSTNESTRLDNSATEPVPIHIASFAAIKITPTATAA